MKDIDVQYPENCMTFTVIYYFYLKESKRKKVVKLVANLYDKKEYVIHIRNLKQTSKQELVLKKKLG